MLLLGWVVVKVLLHKRRLAMRLIARKKIWDTVCFFSLHKTPILGCVVFVVVDVALRWGDVVAANVAVFVCGFTSM